MKRKISIFLAVILVLSIVLPMGTLAADGDPNTDKIEPSLSRAMELFPDDAYIDSVRILTSIETDDQAKLDAFAQTYLQGPHTFMYTAYMFGEFITDLPKEKILELSALDSVVQLRYFPTGYVSTGTPQNVPGPEISSLHPKIEYKASHRMEQAAEDDQIPVIVNLNNGPSPEQLEAMIQEALKLYDRPTADNYNNARHALRQEIYLPLEREFLQKSAPGCSWYRLNDIAPAVFLNLTKSEILALADDPLVESIMYFYDQPTEFEAAPKPDTPPDHPNVEAALWELLSGGGEDDLFRVCLDLDLRPDPKTVSALRIEEMQTSVRSTDIYDLAAAHYRANRQLFLAAEEEFAANCLTDACIRWEPVPIRPAVYIEATRDQILALAENEAVEMIFNASPLPAEPSFEDVEPDRFYHEPVCWAVSKGITAGTDKTHFSPDAKCTRGQAVTFLWRAAGSPEVEDAQNPFEDIKESDFYYKAVLWAVKNGVTTGLDATHFGPSSKLTRGQFVTFLWRAKGGEEVTGTKEFTDVPASKYCAKAVAWAVENGITTGATPTTFAPDAKCTRAQVVTFLARAYN